MALDVYVGPLTLYYAGQWENGAQEAARLQGEAYHTIRLDDPEDKVEDPERIRAAIVAWRSQLSDGLGSNIVRPLDWDEHCGDYVTARPNWDGFGSLILWVVCPLPRYQPVSQSPAALASPWADRSGA